MNRVLGLLALVLVLAGCDTVQEASDSVGRATDKASICVEALKLAGFSPNLGNPEQAAKDARQTAEDLDRLANQAPDASLKEALAAMSDKVGELNPANLNPAEVARWTTEKVTTVDRLARACAG